MRSRSVKLSKNLLKTGSDIGLSSFIEGYFYRPSFFQKLLSLLLYPFSLLYALFAWWDFIRKKKLLPPLPVVSVGNLTVGGSGKTPFAVELASQYENSAIVLRGYKRQSSGTILVGKYGKRLVSVDAAGDEASMLSSLHSKGFVIVAESRMEGIQQAKEVGAQTVFLDDGFRHGIQKFDILLFPKTMPYYRRCLPSGAYRLPYFLNKKADLVINEGKEYRRVVNVTETDKKLLLVTAIANPERLDAYLPQNVVAKMYLPDHAGFDEESLKEKMQQCGAEAVLTTMKDRVKMEGFGFEITVLELRIEIDETIKMQVKNYLQEKLNTII